MEIFPIITSMQLNQYDVAVLRKYCATIEKPNCYLEIGTLQGGSALIARTATKEPIYTIDIRNGYNLNSCDLDINFILGNSADISARWNQPIGVLFIDGNHNKAYRDFLDWERFVVNGGYILIHDYIDGHSEITVKEDCVPILSDDRYEKLFIPDFNDECTRILQLRKL